MREGYREDKDTVLLAVPMNPGAKGGRAGMGTSLRTAGQSVSLDCLSSRRISKLFPLCPSKDNLRETEAVWDEPLG